MKLEAVSPRTKTSVGGGREVKKPCVCYNSRCETYHMSPVCPGPGESIWSPCAVVRCHLVIGHHPQT